MKIRDEAFRYYFYFIQERMNIFWRRWEGSTLPLTEDPIFAAHKFTNVYRVLDRVSQYLVKEVIYNSNQFNEIDTLFRILVFKVFNNIDTWKFLEEQIGPLTVSNFDVKNIALLLSKRIENTPIFNGAYLMNGSHQKYNGFSSKHEKWLRMIEQEMLVERRLERIIKASTLEEIYNILQECTFIGGFLAYQYAIDFNYSAVIDFDENSFVKAGIGAIRGIKKCFPDSNKYSYEDCIRYTQDNFEKYQEKYECNQFRNLFGRQPTLIDLQNCFCETDKYLRVKMPELQLGNKRIKQKFISPKTPIDFFFPPKWGINTNPGQSL
jgi:hypothetical protein